MSDSVQRFVFDDLDARGCIVRLQETCETIQATHHYPDSLASVLNEFAGAVVLLKDSIKLDGGVTIQLRTQGAVSLLMADCFGDNTVRAICEYDIETYSAKETLALNELGSGAVLAITITPNEGERYQGIVPIEHAQLSDCLEDYFARSEQLPTWFRMSADKEQVTGIALHALPSQKITDKDISAEHFERLNMLLHTLTNEEALTLSSETILTRLFHQEKCRLFDSKSVSFGCDCSAEKSLAAIKSLGQSDLEALIQEQQEKGQQMIVTDCHFCFQRYEFSFEQLKNVFDD